LLSNEIANDQLAHQNVSSTRITIRAVPVPVCKWQTSHGRGQQHIHVVYITYPVHVADITWKGPTTHTCGIPVHHIPGTCGRHHIHVADITWKGQTTQLNTYMWQSSRASDRHYRQVEDITANGGHHRQMADITGKWKT
jgi:hypothetical protein